MTNTPSERTIYIREKAKASSKAASGRFRLFSLVSGNAGHTVVNEKGAFALHLLPSGIFREGVVNILGNGVALDPKNLWTEITELRQKGVSVTPENLKISERASLLMPWHRELDALEEQRLADKKFGSTKQGIAPFYSAASPSERSAAA